MQAYKEETKPISDPFAEEDETEELPAAEEPETTLTRKEDGTYCWKSEMDLKRDNWMLGFLMKAILIPSAVLFLGALVFTLSSGTPIRNILMGYGVLLAVLGVVAVIIWFSHWLTTRMFSDSKMIMQYEMNEKGVAYLDGRGRYESAFRGIRTIRIDRESHRLYLNSWFLYNVICCEEADFDFIVDYITTRCPRARILGD